MLLKEQPLSLPIFCVALGAAIFAIPGIPGVPPNPQDNLKLTERLTEFTVIVALTGAGLKLDRTISLAGSRLTWRLLAIAMPLTIAGIAFLGSTLLGLGLASAILLGAALAPTDPVLASDVQAGPPGEGQEDEVRFTLTAEAGFNDGLAFPFVNLAIALALVTQTGDPWFIRWLTLDVFWKLAAGAVIGFLIGRSLGWLTFRLPNRARISRTGDGFAALGITAICYGVTELAHGYGFLAVFIAALSFRSVERNHKYHERLHDFIEQLERLLMMILLVIFGGAISAGGLISEMSWSMILFACGAIFIVRPLFGWISLLGAKAPAAERAMISFFGIRGAGSAYYLAYALGMTSFEAPDRLWSATALVVLISVVLHGATATPLMRHLDGARARRRKPGDTRGKRSDA
jgi:NhaP-type Na+/H+ or K+/H+ antiporter